MFMGTLGQQIQESIEDVSGGCTRRQSEGTAKHVVTDLELAVVHRVLRQEASTQGAAMISKREDYTFEQHLTDQGYSPKDIELIMLRVAEYDRTTLRDSVFDCIEDGSIDLEQFISNALQPHEE